MGLFLEDYVTFMMLYLNMEICFPFRTQPTSVVNVQVDHVSGLSLFVLNRALDDPPGQ